MCSCAEAAIQQGSKTFALAGMFFSRQSWTAATQIYHWCRYCDDRIDHGGDLGDVLEMRQEIIAVLDQGSVPRCPAVESIARVSAHFGIPSFYPLELLKGMEMDASGETYGTFQELEVYCYRVASTVGLMLCYVMGIFRAQALEEASRLGIALQLTNIARDVREDFENKRLYLPREELEREGIQPSALMADPDALFRVVLRVLERAEAHYQCGLRGTLNLPFRSAFVVTLAALFYREIGREIKRTGPAALRSRTVVGMPRKLFLFLWAILLMLSSIPERIRRRSRIISIDQTWCPYI